MIGISRILLFNTIIAVNSLNQSNCQLPEDAILRVPEIIKKYGYPIEVHHVVTIDGYILEMHRIPYGRAGKSKGPKKVVFLQHGFMSSSSVFILLGPNKALAYLLADAGYDVWMGNNRGNTYSRRHVKFDPDKDKEEFWSFTWHEMGVFDLPANIDHILQETAQNKLFYIGHSLGAASFNVMCAERPEYNNKIIAMIGLAPIAFMGHIKSIMLRVISRFEEILGIVFDMVGKYEIFPRSNLSSSVFGACNKFSLMKGFCRNSIFSICGFSSKQFNEAILPLIAGHSPAGCNAMQARHFAQLIVSGKFSRFKFLSPWRNFIAYGSLDPPEYNLKNIVAPIYLFYSKNDWLSDEIDVKLFAQQVPGIVGMDLVDDKEFNHNDFLYGINITDLIDKPILKLLAKATNTE